MREEKNPEKLLLEAGQRNSAKDKEAIKKIVLHAVGQLNSEDAAEAIVRAMRENGIRLKDIEDLDPEGEEEDEEEDEEEEDGEED